MMVTEITSTVVAVVVCNDDGVDFILKKVTGILTMKMRKIKRKRSQRFSWTHWVLLFEKQLQRWEAVCLEG